MIKGEEQLRKSVLSAIAIVATVCCVVGARAETPGVTKDEIKIGNTVPYSGPVSSKGVTGRIIEEYFAMINEKDGVNGRKLKLFSLDDAFSPPKTAVRRPVEGEEVAFMFGMFGTAQNVATAKYLNAKKVPQLFLVSSSVQWDDPKGKPWSLALPWAPPLYAEAGIDVAYARKKIPDARFAILYQNDDAGREYVKGVRDALGPDADKLLVSAQSFNVTDPTIDSQIAILANTKADVFLIYSLTSKACVQVLSKANNLGWKPLRFLASSCANTGSHGTGRPGRCDRGAGAGVCEALGSRSQERSGDGRIQPLYEGAPAQRRSQQSDVHIRLHDFPGGGRRAGAVQG
jgi:ABC-type branched-subunit amino acid transport system substrate-binding protein